jgi:hypothetical protein
MGATSAAGGPGGEGRGSTPGAKLPLLLSPTDLDTLLPLCMAQVRGGGVGLVKCLSSQSDISMHAPQRSFSLLFPLRCAAEVS